MNRLRLYLLALAALFVCSVKADEGMWLLQLMQQQHSIDMMKKQGLKLEAQDLYNPNGISLKDAVGIFGGGCTGEIILSLIHIFRMDSCPLLGCHHHPFPPTDTNRRDAFGRSNQPREPYPSMDHQGTIDCYCLSPSPGYTFIYLLASVAIWNGHDCFLHPVMGRRTGIDLMDLPQEVLKSYP